LARSLALLAAVGVAVLAISSAAVAQTGLTITADEAVNNFPDGITFSATVSADEQITDIRLRYEVLPDGTAASARPEFAPGTSAAVEVTLDEYLAPGTIINYHWEVRAGGETAESPEQSFFYDDIRFQWEKVEAGGLAVYHYTGDGDVAQALLEVGAETVSETEALLEVQVPFPINVWVYGSREDMVPALPRTSPTYEEQVVTLGVRIASDTVLVLGEVSYDTLRHELAHVVTAEAGDSAFGSLPAWLDEGTAVWAQRDKGGYGDAIEAALDRGNVFSISEITSSPGEASKVTLFYGQSWSIVQYLIDQSGSEKFAELFAEIKAGSTMDEALEAAYGFDQIGLENEWRAANGLPARATPEPTEPPQRTTAPQQTADEDGGTPTGMLIAVAAGVLALAAAVGFAGITLARRLG